MDTNRMGGGGRVRCPPRRLPQPVGPQATSTMSLTAKLRPSSGPGADGGTGQTSTNTHGFLNRDRLVQLGHGHLRRSQLLQVLMHERQELVGSQRIAATAVQVAGN